MLKKLAFITVISCLLGVSVAHAGLKAIVNQQSSNGGALVTLGSSNSVTNPQRSGDATTGLFSSATSDVEISLAGVTVLDFPIGGSIAQNGNTRNHAIGLGYDTLNGLSPASFVGWNDYAFGYQALANATSDHWNVCLGNDACFSQVAQTDNTAVGEGALFQNTASFETAVGSGASLNQTSGTYNASFGYQALNQNISGSFNTVVGAQAGLTQKASGLTAVGQAACISCWSNNNTAIGVGALSTASESGSNNTVVGAAVASTTLVSGGSNILVGTSSATDTVSASTSNEVNIGGLIFYNTVSLAAPAVTACGTGTPAIDTHGNNRSGTLTAGGGALTSCTLTFAGGGYTTWNHCRVTFHNSVLPGAGYSYTKTVLTITATSLTAAVFDYDCDGY